MKIDKETLKFLHSIKNKRSKIVIDHILENGFITTEQLEKDYGYNHPPRAARDVREAGIPLETSRVKSSDGRWIAAYRFGDLSTIRKRRQQGRQSFPKKLKKELFQKQDGKCAICDGVFKTHYFQIDHKIPYEISGDTQEEYMLLCGSCNRAKSWSCEHCPNWANEKSPELCQTCYWANPDNYMHIALEEIRRLDILWVGENDVQIYEKIKKMAKGKKTPMPEYVKEILSKSARK
ncbi:MAG: HNH endonuclease [Anaerolineaceae bacterium 4572_5.1]|nr:MAG: HNH endonuclease [Anaerolineaceae bacterium 4572_5.1]